MKKVKKIVGGRENVCKFAVRICTRIIKMKKFYVSPLVSEIEMSVELGFCQSNGEASGLMFSSTTGTSGYYDEEN